MKIACQSCAAKYTIADEKVVGKVIKIKCKKCSSTIVVNGNDPATLAQASGGGDGFDDQMATQLVQGPAGMPGYGAEPQPSSPGGNPDEWTVSISDDDQRSMTTAQILTEYAKGTLTADTYLWKDGMGDWLPIHQVEEIASLLAASAGSAPAQQTVAAQPAPYQNGNAHYGQTAPMEAPVAAAAAAAAAPAAARRSGARGGGGVDLFGGGGHDARPSSNGGAGMAPAGATQPMGHVGERNETSVLFSLKDLAAAEKAAAKPPTKTQASNDRVDDFLSLGSLSAAPMLAPPPLHAPIIEPPPPPAPVSVQPVAATPMMMSPAMMPPQKKSPVPFIVGGLGALALVGGILFFVMAGGKSADKTASGDDTKSKTEEKTDAKSEKTAEPTKSAEATTTSSNSVASTSDTASAEPTASGSSTVASASGSAPKTADTSKLALNDPTKKTDPTKKEEPKKEEPKKEEPVKEEPAGKGGDAPFDRGAASAAMSAAAGRASGCKKADGPTGSTKVQVTFQPSGKGTAPSVGAPFAGTSVGSCIAGAFKGLSIPPFSGAAMPVSKTVTIK